MSKSSTQERSDLQSNSSRGTPKMSDGDWLCSNAECGNCNFSWRTSCNRCGAEKSHTSSDAGSSSGSSSYSKKKKLGQEIGKAMAEKSRGLFSADDWQCNKCGNVNWARRHQCNVCNAPRYGEVEERTGYGGGYNDRGVVEYIEREDSDDEWDEFGRKKKSAGKKRSLEPSNGSNQNKRRRDERGSSPASPATPEREEDDCNSKTKKGEKNGSDVEDEDEEEEEDDGDLSKYDLSGWGDEENAS